MQARGESDVLLSKHVHAIVCQTPITFLVNCIGQCPGGALWMFGTKGIAVRCFNLSGLLEWLCEPSRIPFYIG
jgi:hypothetical protein